MLTAAYAAVLEQVRGITWPARHRSRSTVAGPHLSHVLGASAEFVEYRGYRQGDDPRLIDWKLLARTNRVYVRLAQERTVVPTMFVVDASGSLAFPPSTFAKWTLARQLAVGLAAVARHAGDPVGLVVAYGERGDGVRAIAPKARRSVLEEMIHALDLLPAGRPPLAPALTMALRRGTRVVLISDFLDETDALLAAGRTFVAAGGELHALHVVAREELDPDAAMRLVEDPEALAVRRPLSAAALKTYRTRFGAWRTDLARRWRQVGAAYTMLVPEAEPLRRMVRRITARGAGAVVGADIYEP